MESNDDRFEQYLSEFQPRRPRALPTRFVAIPIWSRRLAAVLLVPILAACLWFAMRTHGLPNAVTRFEKPENEHGSLGERKKIAMVKLTKLAVENPGNLDALLGGATRRSTSTSDKTLLGVLGKERE